MIEKVLVANRAEIAVRILRAAREEGIATVAVHSDADADAVHVRMADERRNIGPPPATESYLNVDAIIAAALDTGCQAIHPGYGFLAENAGFARKVEEAGLAFVGPRHDSIAAMGDKLEARRLMTEAGVAVVPGVTTQASSLEQARAEAAKIGYPILVKAAGGGGGKGMRLVSAEAELGAALDGASREAASAFGDARVYLEKYLVRPRHVEIQVFADEEGNACHFFERECSIQRRHQKIVEESPSPALDEELRTRMGEAAVRAAQAVGYRSAGTVEFMLDQNKNFYFLEMNTRIQVEHPVTEWITGVDLVRLQFRIANGARLPFAQDQIQRRGHAIECRIYAEDPDHNFLPSPGKLLLVRWPSGPGVRVDSGIEAGLEVSTYYDPILAKIITWGEDREMARVRMIQALEEMVILGVVTPGAFLIDVLEHPAFIAGETHTGFLDDHGFLDGGPPAEAVPDDVLLAAALHRSGRGEAATAAASGPVSTPWTELGAWRPGS
jgi:acetyl-CoA carboxylase biotin carboxylase subunit